MSSSALWLYEFKFQMVSGYSTLVQFQSGTRKKKFVIYTIRNLIVDYATIPLNVEIQCAHCRTFNDECTTIDQFRTFNTTYTVFYIIVFLS